MTAVIEFLNKLASKGVKLSVEGGRLNCYAKKGVLTDEIRSGIAKHKQDIIALLERRQGRPSPRTDTSPSGRAKEGAAHAGYWERQLEGDLPAIEILPDFPRPASTDIERQMLVEELPEELHRWVADFSGTYSLPPAVIFLAVFQLLLHRYTGQDDIIVGMVCDEQRFSAEAGYFTNMAPVRTRCEEQLGFKAFLSSVHNTMLDALAHSSDLLPLMLDRLPRGHKNQPSIFQVAYAYQSFAKQAGFTTLPPEAGLSIENIPGVSHRGDVGFGDISLGLAVYEQEKSCDLRLTYDPALYRQETAQHFLSRYRTLLKEISKAPDLLIRDYSIVTEQEKQRLLVEYAGTHTNYPKDKCIHDLFVRQALMNPGKTAIVFGKQELSYQELYDKSRDLALYLQSTGVKSESVVGLCIERSVDMIVGLLGILQAGGAYMPLDPDYPEDRLAYMLQESRAAFVLTQKKLLDKLTPLVAPDVRLIALDQRWPEITECAAGLRQKNVTLQQESNPRQLAYVTFTSGSTGKPKGVMVEHQSVNRLFVNTNYIQIAEDDVFLLMSSLSFDAATFEIWGPLANGSKLVIAPHGLSAISQIGQLVKEHRISVLWLTSALFQLIVNEDVEILSDVRVLLAGGDVVPIEHAREFASRCSRPILVNGYGPTENTTFSSCYVASNGLNEPMRSLPIGQPISNTQIYILDARNNPQPVGIPGELHVAGDGLARGYLNRAELTAEKFVANPFAPGERMYKTGDLARWLPDGNIEFLGRLDTQVKVRGFRIETSEIEAALNRHPAIRDSVVVAQGDEGNKQLTAFYVARDSNADGLIKLPGRDLRTYLQQTLPAYMLPSAFVNLAAIPLNSNGKVDRRALALIEVRIASDQEYIAPRTDVEKQLVEIWAQVLNVAPEKIGVNDNFFELGGHSLLATQLIAKIRSMVDIDLPLTILFERSSIAQLADLIAKAEKSVIPAIRPVDRAQFDRLPLSFAQEQLWFIDQFGPGNAGYNVPVSVTISGELNISQLEHALNLIVARHESLRTIFPGHEGRAQQLILDHLDFRLERIDLSHSSTSEERNNKANEICRTEAATPFDLALGPLIRGKVIKLAEQEHVLLLNMHHIITDGWSLGILTRELGSIMEALRQGRNPELPPMPIQYVDYAVWQRAWLEESGTLQQQLGYWQEKLAGAAESLDLATDYPRPNVQGFAGATHVFTLDAQLTGQLKSMAQQQGGTLYMVLLAAFKVLLHRYTGQSDICVGSPIANRQYGETEGLIGMFVNTLALRSQVESEDTFSALLSRVKATCLEAYEHQDTPFEKVVDTLHPQRNAGTNPIFQVMVILQNADMGALDQRFPWNLLQTGTSLFDLTAEFTEIAEGLAGTIKYSTALYKQATIARMARHFAALCQAIITTPTAKIHDLDYLSDAEKQRLPVDYNGTQADYPKDKCLHELFIEQAALHGGDLALVCGDEQLTYQQLYERSQKLALYLQSLGIKPDNLVGLCMERSLDMVVGLLGILQAGGAYVPLDPSHPDDRLAHALQDSQATVVLTQKHLQEKLNALKPALTQVIPVDEQWMEIGERVAGLKARKVELQQSVKPHHLAYVIYTSGSSGLPKGVMVEHRSVVNLFFGLKNSVYRGLKTSGLRVSMNGPLTFDTSVKQIIQLLAGHVLDIVPESVRRDSEALLRFVRDRKIEVFDCTPSQLRLLLEAGLFRETTNGSMRQESLQLVLVGGEAIDDAMWTALAGSGIRFFNVYGPTECTVDATVCPILPEHAPQSIGAPITNTQIYILDSHRRPQPIGVPGELHIAGDGLARGYLNRPELTQEKFVANPFTPGTRMYKTGDLARWLDDGNIQYLGRIDTQVKVRGFRIELGEIEAQLNLHSQIQDSAVIAKDQDGSKQLIAFYRAKETTAEQLVQLPNEELCAHLLRTLPDYMAPAAFVSLAAIPLSPNGKVDRRALARIEVKIASDQEYLAPRNEVEKQLVEIWAQVLHLAPEKIGVNDNFFELGGHSLLATQVMAKIRSRLGIELPLKALFERTRVAQLAELIPQLAKRDDVPTIRPVDRTKFQQLPLSFAQERLWFIDQLEPNSAGYNLPLALTIPGDLDISQVEQALNVIIARHENLRTVFPTHEGQAQQLILDHLDFKLERIDLSHESKQVRDKEAQEICRTEVATSFDLARGPLIRGKVIKLAEQEHILLLNMHHIITDGWSLGILTGELGSIMEALRQGRNPELPPLPIQYVDYAVWQRAWLEESGTLQQQLGYWQEKLAGAAESLDLATDYPRPSVQGFAGTTHVFTLDAQLTGQLKSMAQQQGGTLYMVLLAAFKLLLHRYTGQSDICVGSPIANRQYGETEGLIGMFVNTLALRSHVESADTFSALLSRVKATCLEAYEHQDAPFEKVVDALRLQPNLAISPIFQVMVSLQNATIGAPEQRFSRYPLENWISKFDIALDLAETGAGLTCFIEYSTALYKQETIARMGEHFTALCQAIIDAPTARICDLDYLSGAEKHRLLIEYNDTRAGYPQDKCIHDFFSEQALSNPGARAVVFGEHELSYQELYERSADLALYLQSLDVKPDSVVGLCMERSLEMMVGIMGIVQAGGAYLPLDPDYPGDRLAYMLQDSEATVVLTQEKFREKINSLLATDGCLIALDEQWPAVSQRAADLRAKKVELREEVQARNTNYVIYTSGSTGKPKGVLVEHRALVNRLHWMQKRYPLTKHDVVLQKTPYSFDVSVWEFFWPMMAGASIVFAAPEGHKDVEYLENLINQAGITTLHFVPSMLRSFLENARNGCGSVKQIFCSGEALDKKSVDDYKTKFPNAVLHNLYGPTEAAIDVTAYDCSRLNYPFVPIGAPIDNTQIYILDPHNQPQPIGVPGELHIAGDGLARGYLNRPELTQEKFVANPFTPGTRMYKTGDLARWLDDGNIQYLGRIDTQVKVRGFRIELGEIEALLNLHPQIQDSAVIAKDQDGSKQLIAFYRAKETTAEQLVQLPNEELRAHLLRTLPEYMVPAAFVSLAAIPLSPNGKVDRRALARIEVKIASDQEYLGPRNEVEKQIVEIWAQVLQLAPEKIGVNDNFFELGGHSLLATQVMAKIRSRLGIDLPLKTLFERTRVAQLAELIPQLAKHDDVPTIRPVDRTKLQRLPLSFAQERLWFIDQLEPNSAGYNLPLALTISGDLDIGQVEQALNVIIARHENLRTVFPTHEGQAQQLILDEADFKLERIDLSHDENRRARDNHAQEICRTEIATSFDLARGPLLRGKVIKLAEQEHVLLLNMHHIITDGWSLGILTRELGSIMEAVRQGRNPELPTLPIQYVDYAVWQRAWLEESGTLKQQLGYWQEKLAGAAESLDLATDYPRPSVQTLAGAEHLLKLDAQLTGRLKSLAQHKGGTLYMVLLAAFKVLLHRYTGQSDICVGSPIANRQCGETEGLIGMFVNTLALRSQVESEDTFSALLSQVKATCLGAYEHQDAPFEKVVDLAQTQRDLSISPLFQVMLILQSGGLGAASQHFQPYALESGVSKFDITISLEETAAGLAGFIAYSTALFKRETIARMGEHFVGLCRAITATPTAKIRDLDYLSSSEKQQLLVDYNATRADYPRERCIHHFFIEQVRCNPGKRAVALGGQELSYQELYEKSCDLALYLQSLGVKPDSVVGLCLERSLEMMLGIMGIVQAGGAYLPADPAYPDDRLEYMLQDSQATVVLTQSKFRNKIGSLFIGDAKVVTLDKQWPEISQCAAGLKAKHAALRQEVKAHNLSYLIYTSGSTGKPKGVLVEHRALVNRLHWMQKRYPLTKHDVVLQKTPYSFDVSVWEFFWPMMAGASIVFAAPEGHKDVEYLENLINQAGITTLHFVPSMLRSFLENARNGCGSVKQIFCSGEALDKKSVDDYKTKFPNAVLHNLYGPTEAAIDVTAYDCSRLNYPFVPIGAPIDNTQIYILDPHNQPQPIGVPGELHIAGDGLARGYLNRPELTQEKFVANPFAPGTRMYKTGDLARWLDDGNIQYLGRIDTQVKVRGFRIELSEIEAQLNLHPQIQDSAVIAKDQDGSKQLIAFYRAKETTAEQLVQLPNEELRAHLLRTLAEYMVPAAFVSLAAIPLSPNGKVDRRALSRKEVKITSGQQYVAPRNRTEKQIVEIWAQVLQLAPEKIGVNDSFFELGGHSLLAVRLIQLMRQQGLHLKLQSLFGAPTPAKLATAVEPGPSTDIVSDETVPDLNREATLDPAIVLQTTGAPGEMRNAFLTGATGFLGAFLLSDLLAETDANIYCLVRDASIEAGYRRIEERLKSLGLWNAALRDRIVPVLGDLSSPLLGLTSNQFEELAGTIDVIYHNGALVNFYYPYSYHKAANVLSTEALLRLASFGRGKSLHFVSTLSVALTQSRESASAIISEKDPLPGAPNLSDGYVQSKWVAEKLVSIAASRGFPVVTYRPGTIMGHSKTGVTNLEDFVPSFIRGCMQAGCAPDIEVHDELHLMPVDFLSRTIVAISKRREFFGRVFNITTPHGMIGRELVDALLAFDPALKKVSYQKWTSRIAGDPGNALARHVAAFPERVPEERPVRPQFDSEETLRIAEAAGIDRPKINQELLEVYFSYIAGNTFYRAAAGDD